jgi:hypothetical protein
MSTRIMFAGKTFFLHNFAHVNEHRYFRKWVRVEYGSQIHYFRSHLWKAFSSKIYFFDRKLTWVLVYVLLLTARRHSKKCLDKRFYRNGIFLGFIGICVYLKKQTFVCENKKI